MLQTKNIFRYAAVVAVFALPVAFTSEGYAATTITTCAVLTVSPQPPVVTEGTSIDLTGTWTERVNSQCTASVVNGIEGKFQWNTRTYTVDQVNMTEPVACSYTAQGGETVGFSDIPGVRLVEGSNAGTTGGSGQVERTLLTAGLGGKTIGIRARHSQEQFGDPPNQTNYPTSNSPCIDVTINEAAVNNCPAGFHGAYLMATQAAGNGSPPAGASGPWIFRIEIFACGGDVWVNSAQGGSNAWVPVIDWEVSAGTAEERSPGGVKSKKQEKTMNKVLLWNLDNKLLYEGESEYIDVTVNGVVPNGALDGQVLYLSGPWSAIYSINDGETYQKSDYTGRVTIVVDNNGL